MTYSFIRPRKKPVFMLFDKIALGLFGFGVVFILFICFIYIIKISLINHSINSEKRQTLSFENQTKENDALYKVLLNQSQIARKFNTQNQAIKESLKNLFDLIVKTDGISLESLEQEEYSLKLIGISSTKEMFALLLETPLKSIFDQSDTVYYLLDNGQYRFVNISIKNPGNLDER